MSAPRVRKGRGRFRWVLAPIALLSALGMVAGECVPRFYAPNDPMLNGDWKDWNGPAWLPAAPGVPVIHPGADGIAGTADDWTVAGLVGDMDIVLRAGTTELKSPIPPPSGSVAQPAAKGLGNEVDFSVVAVDGQQPNPLDQIVVSPSFGVNPVIVLGFADLDADGWIGPNQLDQNAFDDEVEQAELTPVALQLADLTGTSAHGKLRLLAGGPAGRPLKVVLTAVSLTGQPEPGLLGGVVPVGPAVSTALPYPVPTRARDFLDAGPGGPEAPTPGRPLGLRLDPEWPAYPRQVDWQAAHAIPVDGSELSVDVVDSASGPLARFGLARSALHPDYQYLPRRVVRPGLDERFATHPYEILDGLSLPDDGTGSVDVLRVVPLDALGNITWPGQNVVVSLKTTGGLRILSPDTDRDPSRESVVIGNAAGARIVVDDAGAASDDPLEASLILESRWGGDSMIPVWLPDADVDDSGRVDERDVAAVRAVFKSQRGDANFHPRFDVDGNGRVEKDDLELVGSRRGASVAVP